MSKPSEVKKLPARASKVAEGRFYFDGKSGAREVIEVLGDKVRYRVLAAKQRRKFRPGEKLGTVFEESLIGTVQTVTVASFAAWARYDLGPDEGQERLLELEAVQAKLSAGEQALMDSVRYEAGGKLDAGTVVSIDHTENRAAFGLSTKGFGVRLKTGEFELSELACAWVRHQIRQESDC